MTGVQTCALPISSDAILEWRDPNIISQLREKNSREGRPLNHGFPITYEEVDLIIKCYKSHWDLFKIVKYFQRSQKSIIHIIERNLELD